MSHAIQVSSVSKRFRRGERRRAVRRLLKYLPTAAARTPTDFWALRDVTFDVRPGEALGIIGPNGAGKSTLLKLLAGIMRPTSGAIALEGRVSALIELGAGFHPDLTGRENIYLNASILGMSRAQTRQKFHDIVEFAGIAEFLDTPIKRYSTGMYARLGFSVAVHADPQILLVDEVLAVGDRTFRAQCMERMREFIHRGVTIVFVSHNLSAVTTFCRRAMVLHRGDNLFLGSAVEAVARYQRTLASAESRSATHEPSRKAMERIALFRADGSPARTFRPGEEAIIELEAPPDLVQPPPGCTISIVRIADRLRVFETDAARLAPHKTDALRASPRRMRLRLRMNLLPGQYCVRHGAGPPADEPRQDPRNLAHFLIVGEPAATGIVDVSPIVRVDADPIAAHPALALA